MDVHPNSIVLMRHGFPGPPWTGERSHLPRSRRTAPGGGRSRCPGFTLIELVISISVGVIISGVAGSLLWNASTQRAEISLRGEL